MTLFTDVRMADTHFDVLLPSSAFTAAHLSCPTRAQIMQHVAAQGKTLSELTDKAERLHIQQRDNFNRLTALSRRQHESERRWHDFLQMKLGSSPMRPLEGDSSYGGFDSSFVAKTEFCGSSQTHSSGLQREPSQGKPESPSEEDEEEEQEEWEENEEEDWEEEPLRFEMVDDGVQTQVRTLTSTLQRRTFLWPGFPPLLF